MSLSNEVCKTLAFTYRNFIITKRNFFTIFETLFWPVLGLISVGLMGMYLNLGTRLFRVYPHRSGNLERTPGFSA
jgi:ABC-2 type transport system permease protein